MNSETKGKVDHEKHRNDYRERPLGRKNHRYGFISKYKNYKCYMET